MAEEMANAKTLLQRAKDFYQQGNLEASADCFQKLLAARETRSEAYYGLGLIEFSKKSYPAALDFFMTATQVDSHNANAYYYIGVIYEEQKNLEESRKSYLKSLSINPNHRGAKEGVDRLGNKTTNSTLPIKANIHPRSEFYELLSNDKSLAAQRALALIDELEFTVKPPIYSHFIWILGRAIISLLAVAFLSGFLNVFLTMIISLAQPTPSAIDLAERHRELFSRTSPPELAWRILASIIPLLLATGIYISINLGIKSAKNTKYEFSRGLIKITKGAFIINTVTIEMYRVNGIHVVQDWFSQRIGYATLVLTTDRSNSFITNNHSNSVILTGVAEVERAYYLQDRLRELTVSLRSLPWIKGIIS